MTITLMQNLVITNNEVNIAAITGCAFGHSQSILVGTSFDVSF